jgi:dUTP pyrophosphatase
MTTFSIKFADEHKLYLETLYNISHNYNSDCGLDLYMPEDITVEPYETKLIDLAIKCEYLAEDKSYLGYQLYPRSSIYKTKIRLANSVGIIDPEYRGYLKVVVDNISDKPQQLLKGNRYFQLVFIKMDKPNKIKIVNELSITTRNENGFGSTN